MREARLRASLIIPCSADTATATALVLASASPSLHLGRKESVYNISYISTGRSDISCPIAPMGEVHKHLYGTFVSRNS